MTTQVRRLDPSDFHWPSGAGPGDGPGAQVRDVLAAAASTDGAAPLDEAALLALRHRGLDGTTMLVTGEPVDGVAWLHDGAVDLVVHPAHRRRGLARALMEAVLAEADDADALTVWSHGHHPGAVALAGTAGFERVRDLWVMRLHLAGPEGLPALPDPAESGVEVRTFRPGQDEEAFLALNAEAFAGHPEQGSLTRADLDRRMAEAWFDPAGFFVAEDRRTGNLLGFHWTKVHPGPPAHGEVYVVGVSPQAQGAGLGRLLTLTGLHHLAGLGLPQVLLYVEADNAAALAVYSRLGFTHDDADTHVMYHRP